MQYQFTLALPVDGRDRSWRDLLPPVNSPGWLTIDRERKMLEMRSRP